MARQTAEALIQHPDREILVIIITPVVITKITAKTITKIILKITTKTSLPITTKKLGDTNPETTTTAVNTRVNVTEIYRADLTIGEEALINACVGLGNI